LGFYYIQCKLTKIIGILRLFNKKVEAMAQINSSEQRTSRTF